MDLRIVKTRKNIREAFLKLRAKNALEKIRVTELCQEALINKTTFYKHYADVYALSDEIENETIQSVMGSFEQMDSLFTDPNGFMKGLYFAFMSNQELIMVLFSGRMNFLIDKVEGQLIAHYPWISDKPENEIILSFFLWGASHVLSESRFEETDMLNTLTRVADQVIAFIGIQSDAKG